MSKAPCMTISRNSSVSLALSAAVEKPVGTVFRLCDRFRQDLRFVVVEAVGRNQLLACDAAGSRHLQLSEVESPFVWRFVETGETFEITFA